MKSWSVTLPALLLLATSATATPTVALHWGSCPFPAGESTNRNQGVAPRDTITVTVKGLSGPVQGAQVFLFFTSQGGLADAWRYDDAGCEAGRARLENASASDPCPPLLGSNPRRITKFQYDELTQRGQLVFAQAFDVLNADPNVTYTLGRFTFDHSAPDPCGCLETPMCILLASASYVDGAMLEFQFAVSQQYLTWNDPANSSHCPFPGGDLGTVNGNCTPTPVAQRSWGSLKASYR